MSAPVASPCARSLIRCTAAWKKKKGGGGGQCEDRSTATAALPPQHGNVARGNIHQKGVIHSTADQVVSQRRHKRGAASSKRAACSAKGVGKYGTRRAAHGAPWQFRGGTGWCQRGTWSGTERTGGRVRARPWLWTHLRRERGPSPTTAPGGRSRPPSAASARTASDTKREVGLSLGTGSSDTILALKDAVGARRTSKRGSRAVGGAAGGSTRSSPASSASSASSPPLSESAARLLWLFRRRELTDAERDENSESGGGRRR